MSTHPKPVLISAEEIDAMSGPVVLADVRWYLDGRRGIDAYQSGHLPGAIFVDLDRDLAGDPGGAHGRHPLPSPEQFARGLGALGVGADDTIVAYDDTGGGTASRLVVMARAIGQSALLLDGGIAAYRGRLETGMAPSRAPLEREPRPWPPELLVDLDDLAHPGPAVLLDARASERFRGEIEPVDSRPGHIPGARNLPWTTLLDAGSGTFSSPEVLRERFRDHGVDSDHPLIASCGSGVTACALLVAHEVAGLGPRSLFVASYSGWSSDPSHPVALGEA